MSLIGSDGSDSDHFLSFSDGGDASSDESYCSFPNLSQSLETHFSNLAKNFNVIHINAQSIPAHFHDMLASFDNKNIHAVLVSESWLKPCLSSISYPLPGFRLIRNDRTDGRGGGVAIYLRAHIPFSIVNVSPQPPPTNAGEHLFVEILLSHTKVLLGVYYMHSSRINFFPSFEKLLEDLTPSYSHSIIMGDFNTCLLKRDHRTYAFETLVKASNLAILPLGATHHFPNCTPSLLDLILVSSSNNVYKHGQCSALMFSYHDLIFLSYKTRPPKAKPQIILQRNFSGMDQECLRKDAQNIDWSEVISAATIDEKVQLFNSTLTNLYNVHAPVRAIKIKHLPAPWLTEEIKELMKKKNLAKYKFKCKPTDENKEKYFIRRNKCNRVCRDAQRRHIHSSVQNDDSSKVWKFLRSLGVGKSRQTGIPNNLNIDLLNKHFTCTSNLADSEKATTLKYLSLIPTPDFPLFNFYQFSDCDVKKSILSISSNAVGSDCISRNMIMPILDEIIPIICHLLNSSISSFTFPSSWKDSIVTPLPKKNNPSSFSEYRPISILPFLSKVLERLVHHQLSIFLNSNILMNPMQSGFRSGHSTATALVKITDDIRLGMDNGLVTILTLLDFSSAFNNVDFDILLGILSSINISPTVIDWFHSYLYGRRQRVRVEDAHSTWSRLTAGVPQGGVLSPLLFAVFINSISKKISSSYHLYADDLQIYSQATVDNLHQAIFAINSDLDQILEWSKAYGLGVNPAKTQVIVIGSSRMLARVDMSCLPQVLFDGKPIPFTNTVKNLGIIMDSELTWSPQLAELRRKMFASAASMRRLRNFLPTATKVTLAQSLLLPILDYADASFPDLTEDQLNKLERLQNLCIRFIFGLRKYDHISEYRVKLKWLPIRLRRDAHILTLLYKVLFNPSSPPYLKQLFEFLHLSNPRNLRSSDSLQLKTPLHNSTFFSKSFTVRAVRLWNDLPVFIRLAKSLPIFKNEVFKLYFAASLN